MKGAFTGAEKIRVGRFEAVHEGTIFLDEIGDIPLHTQVKLLRVFEKKIEREGENISISIDVRIISATNRNLDDLVDTCRFREDLFLESICFRFSVPICQTVKRTFQARYKIHK